LCTIWHRAAKPGKFHQFVVGAYWVFLSLRWIAVTCCSAFCSAGIVGVGHHEVVLHGDLWRVAHPALCTNRLPTASSWYERVTGRNPAIEIVNEWETWQGGQIALHVKIGREAAAARINPASSSLTIEPKSSSRPLRRLAVEVLEQPAQPLPALDLGEIAEGQRAIAASDLGRLASRPRQEHISHSLMWP